MDIQEECLALKKALEDEKNKNKILQKQNKKLLKIKDSFDAFLDHTSDYVYIKDFKHRFVFVSEPFAKITGHKNRYEIIGKTDFDIFPLKDAEVYYKEQKNVIEHGKELVGIEEPYHNEDGELRWISTSKKPLYDSSGNVTGLIGISRDITVIKKLEDELEQKAYFDNLTGLYNRHYFFEKIKSIIKLTKRTQNLLTLFFIDLDDFKAVNDKYGHEAGNEVLRVVSKRLKSIVRESDIICRFGGDEFIILAVAKEKDDLKKIAKKILVAINESIPYLEYQLHVGCSIGISSNAEHTTSIDTLIKKSDNAMYKAKKTGKNNFFIAV